MRKTIILLLLIGLLVLATSQTVLAFGPGNGRGMKERICGGNVWFGLLAPETQEQIREIRESYREQMAALRQEIRSLRQAGDTEGLAKAREELTALKEEMKQKIEALLPAELKEKFGEMGPGNRRGFRGNMMGNFNVKL
jgi:Spy/CpxP family protein refolding chaperone